MKQLVSARLAGTILLAAFGTLAIFHILVLPGLLPSNIIWGGQAAGSPARLLTLELVALLATFLLGVVIAAKAGYIRAGRLQILVSIGIWIVFAYLLLNTAGNIASGARFENLIFAPITLILAARALRLAVEK